MDYLPNFLTKEEIISSFYFIIYKNANYIDKSILEMMFTSLISYEKLNISIVIDVFLDFKLFDKLKNETKKYLLNLIDRKLLSIDNFDNDIILLEKLSNLLILSCNDSNKNKDNNTNNNFP